MHVEGVRLLLSIFKHIHESLKAILEPKYLGPFSDKPLWTCYVPTFWAGAESVNDVGKYAHNNTLSSNALWECVNQENTKID